MAKGYFHFSLGGASSKLICLVMAASMGFTSSGKGATSSAQQLPSQSGVARPNIVLLLFDDAGYSDMSAFGGEIQTPNVERISREGMTVRRFYTAARCSPTRAGILSGRHPHEVGMADLAGPSYKTGFSAYQGQLPLEIPLVSELLQDAGYRTYLQGKWHLGTVPGSETDTDLIPAPNMRGFDEFIGYLGGMAGPYPSISLRTYLHNQNAIEFDEGWFSITGLNEAMLGQLQRQFQTAPDTPFFVYFASQSPHVPLQAPQVLVDKYRKIYERPLQDIWQDRVSRMRDMGLFPPEAPVILPKFSDSEVNSIRAVAATRAAMIEATDAELGKLLQLLEANGKLDSTLIIVTSDNGAASTFAKLSNAPFRGAKGVLGEGGTLSPLVARWPGGKIKGRGLTDVMATYLDLMPTFLQVAGVTYPSSWNGGTRLSPLEGRNLLPLFQGESLPPPENFYWNLDGQFAVLHKGQWKLLGKEVYNEKEEPIREKPVLALYDLISDPAETSNLVGKQKSMTSKLSFNYQRWADEHGAVPRSQVLDAYESLRSGYDRPNKDFLRSIGHEDQ